jgi:hypothetical protein
MAAIALEVTRLLRNPLGQPAPEGDRGDVVRVGDGAMTIYLTLREYDAVSERRLRCLLVRGDFTMRA